jgi:hypothetical protein
VAAERTIEGFIEGFDDWRGDVLRAIDRIVRDAAPSATGSIKWSQPVYEVKGPFAYVKPFTNAVNFGFWRGADLADPKALLEGTGDRMRHVKIRSTSDVRPAEFTAWVKEAVQLNEAKGDPTRRR